MEDRATFDLFKKLHPNSGDVFEPTATNLKRWAYHISEAGKMMPLHPFGMPVPTRSHIELRNSRRATGWHSLPSGTRARFEQIAMLMPGRRVYATGSRVTGAFVERESPRQIREMRAAFMYPDKEESDWDVWVERREGDNMAEMRSRLPAWADLCVNIIPEDEKIEIPVWDFTKLPKNQHQRAIDLFAAKRWGDLIAMHDRYELSTETYCCGGHRAVERWFRHGIETGQIGGPENQTENDGTEDKGLADDLR